MLTGSSNAVNLTDGLDGLAAGSSILVLTAYVFITFWQFRHPCTGTAVLNAEGCYDVNAKAMLDSAIVAAGMMGAATGSYGGTRRRRRSSWATPGRWHSAGSSARWP